MTIQRSPLTRAAALAVAALALSAPLAACSSDDDDDTSTDTSAPASSTTEDATTDGTEAPAEDESSDTTAEDEAASGEVGTTELLDFLNAEDPAIGALFDWNVGDGIIAVNYMGVQTVGLYAVDIDAATATQACELASEYVFGVDEAAAIEVYTGGYDAATLVVSRTGVDGACTTA